MELSSLFLAGKGSALTSFFSTAFLVVFLPFCLVVYSLMPRRGKKYFLLAADCAFFWLISGKLLVYLLLTALSMHYFGLWLDKIQLETKLLLAQTEKAERKTVRKRQQAVQHWILLLAVILHIGVLFALKYSGFAATNVNTLLAHLHIPVQLAIPKYVMPIGISFFTLQALSYIVDVQRGVTKADTNLLRLTLFISFFPQIVEGPICRYDQTAQQLWDAKPITYTNLTLGLQRIAYGMMKKVVIADRLNPLVKNVFTNYADFDGGVIALAAVCYTVQLYMDFSGSMDAVTGTAQILGVTMPENFRQPFFSKTISEFWKRWHITLGTWFRDYLYIPLGGSRNGKRRLLLSLFVVWTLTGLWHGAAWNFVLWGLVLFVFIALEKFCIGGFLERHRFLSRLYFLFLIPQTWVVFRISDLGELGDYFSRLYPFLSSGESVFAGDLLRQLKSYWWLFALGILLATPWPRRFYEKYRATPLVWLPLFAVFWLCLYLIATGTGNPFLYARF